MIYNWNRIINRALFLYTHRDNITYNLGSAGEVAGRDDIVERTWKYYYNTPEWHEKIGSSIPGWNTEMSTDEAWSRWLDIHRGQMCFDCSGLIDWCVGYEGIHKYSSWDFAGMKKNESVPAGCAGSAVWKKGHVELDIGYGACIGIGSYGNTLTLTMLNARDFTSSHLIDGVDYEGADAR